MLDPIDILATNISQPCYAIAFDMDRVTMDRLQEVAEIKSRPDEPSELRCSPTAYVASSVQVRHSADIKRTCLKRAANSLRQWSCWQVLASRTTLVDVPGASPSWLKHNTYFDGRLAHAFPDNQWIRTCSDTMIGSGPLRKSSSQHTRRDYHMLVKASYTTRLLQATSKYAASKKSLSPLASQT
ncbi:hypothetical protein AC579_10099 [Pseudocercospora musae]|uniref:Uncharacterized protein n=1 Tax=Pseudocercospora musae TaxID=113226 RepID=A0A139I291_9PEZI|nr:hypothetical protein AC579_10099 [Pseudocercospora musae]